MQVMTIYGPPGTGKTHRLVQIAREHLNRDHLVCYISYTKAAAEEATSRLSGHKNVSPSTLHSLAFKAFSVAKAQVVDYLKLANLGETTGYRFKSNRADDDAEPELGDEYLAVESLARNKQIPLDLAYDQCGSPGVYAEFLAFVQTYNSWKKTYGFIDFNDMLAKLVDAPPERVPKFDCIILDEAQDCSALQWKAFERLVEFADHIYVAGDDDQAIFEWNGAEAHGMEEFTETYSGNTRVLDQSYRLPSSVFNLSKDVIAQAQRRKEKQFKPTDSIGTIDVFADTTYLDEVLTKTGFAGMVLVRDRFRSREMQRTLNQLMIPYSLLGSSSVWENRYADAARLAKRLINGGEIEGDDRNRMTRYMKTEWLNKINAKWRSHDLSGVRWFDLLNDKAMPFNMIDFYDKADMEAPRLVTLSTVHQAKGREHRTVILDASISGRALEQMDENPDAEVRVQYVAVTRCAEHLIICGTNPVLAAIGVE